LTFTQDIRRQHDRDAAIEVDADEDHPVRRPPRIIKADAVDLAVLACPVAVRDAHATRTRLPMDELLAGQWLSARVCPHCGHPPDDFVDEETVVE
jgi:hypothetical protein